MKKISFIMLMVLGIVGISSGQDINVNNTSKLNIGVGTSPYPGRIFLYNQAGSNVLFIEGSGATADTRRIRFIGEGGIGFQGPITMNGGLSVLTNGNVLIGKSSQVNSTYKLDVAGSVRANEVIVNTSGADFVFEDNYKLRSLEEVENFIFQNKHLPEIPSAREMQENGVSVSDLQTKLLQKVEELTLYIIQLQKENEKLANQISANQH